MRVFYDIEPHRMFRAVVDVCYTPGMFAILHSQVLITNWRLFPYVNPSKFPVLRCKTYEHQTQSKQFGRTPIRRGLWIIDFHWMVVVYIRNCCYSLQTWWIQYDIKKLTLWRNTVINELIIISQFSKFTVISWHGSTYMRHTKYLILYD